ncbi:Uncharacterized protein dnm_015410 [Desulfonema magnum]|uniref:Uncharacterized protein n=1 Tax=Desulfonema magnum TaxID=45655 RepID=A0A975GLF7_9BACT|nr:Uncharacterized protein dnm_015410 [Desulfonema magnum]
MTVPLSHEIILLKIRSRTSETIIINLDLSENVILRFRFRFGLVKQRC